MKNVLLLNIGRHVGLLQQLIETKIGPKRVYVAENDPNAPACVLNKKERNITVKRALEKGFAKDILSVCKKLKIDYLFSFIDYGLSELAGNAESFKRMGTRLVVSPKETIKLCEDKFEFYKKLSKNNINCVTTFLNNKIKRSYKFPYFAKPRYGNSSSGISLIENKEDLLYYSGKKDYIFQPFMKDEEYGIDLLVKDGVILDMFMKKKIAMRAGTTDKAISVWDKKIARLVEKLSELVKFEGPIDIDIFKHEGRYVIAEVNPRFGGGYTTAIACGKNFFYNYIKGIKSNKQHSYPKGRKVLRYEKTLIANK